MNTVKTLLIIVALGFSSQALAGKDCSYRTANKKLPRNDRSLEQYSKLASQLAHGPKAERKGKKGVQPQKATRG